jgi:hypothetical protein
MSSPPTLLALLALVLALVSAVVLVPLWIPVALLAAAFLVRERVVKL